MVTLDDIKQELKLLGVKEDQLENGYTSTELAAQWDWPVARVRVLLNKCYERGLVQVIKRRFTNIAGSVSKKPAYVFMLSSPDKVKVKRRKPTA